jgi:hypothetical protein
LPRNVLTRCAHIFCGLSRRLTRSVSKRDGVAQCIVPRDAAPTISNRPCAMRC